jgi:MFS transporter, ACS family, aldohexuronate transporter
MRPRVLARRWHKFVRCAPLQNAAREDACPPGEDAAMKAQRKWLIIFLLFLATLLNYLDRQTIAVTAGKISEEMELNDAHLGQLFFAFLFAYGVSQLFIGSLLDRLRVRVAYAAAVIAWSVAGAAAALASGFWPLFGLRVLLGFCESPNWPLALRVVARTIPANQRSLATGIFQSGTSIGALVAGPLIIFLANAYGWRFAFAAVGAVGLVWAALWLSLFHSEPDADEQAPGPEPQQAESPASYAEILRSRAFWGLALASCFLQPLQYFYITWMPRYFDKYAGVGFGARLATILVIIYLALDLGFLTGGAVVVLLARRLGVRLARQLVIAAGALLMMVIPFASQLRDVNWITAVICVATFGLGWFQVNYLTFTSEVSARRVSTAAGLLGGLGSLSGGAFMLLVGGTVERSGGFNIAFLMAGLMPLVSLTGIWLGTRQTKESGAYKLAESSVENI